MEKKRIIQSLLMFCVALGAFAVGMALYEPRHCALCEAPENNVPCLLDLHSGETGELRISKHELSDDPSTFGFSFMRVLGNTGYRDTSTRVCEVTIPQDDLHLSPQLFCRDCRKKMKDIRNDHFAVLDTVNKTVYPLRESGFSIGAYSVTVTQEEKDMHVVVRSDE